MEIVAEDITRLVLGSRNIDRMREEIKLVVSAVLGLTSKYGKKLPYIMFPSESERCTWVVECSKTGKGGYFAYCNLRCSPLNQGRLVKCAYVSKYPNFEIACEDVQVIYEDLPNFLQGMINCFPELLSRLAPLLKASLVKFN